MWQSTLGICPQLRRHSHKLHTHVPCTLFELGVGGWAEENLRAHQGSLPGSFHARERYTLAVTNTATELNLLIPKTSIWTVWCTAVIPGLWRLKYGDCYEFKASLGSIVTVRPASATQWYSVSKIKTIKDFTKMTTGIESVFIPYST